MAKLGTILFKGESGKEYNFDVYNFSKSWKAVSAVYVVTRATPNANGGHTHTILYIGQTSDLQQRFANHHKQDCFDNNSANRLCLKVGDNEDVRFNIETDLIRNYNPTCND